MKCSSMILLLFAFFSQCIVCSWQVVQFRCPYLQLLNGKVRVRARGRIVRFNCYDGFTLVGNRYTTCVRGEWDTPIPLCVSAECPIPAQPAHAIMAKKFDGAILMFFCETNYTLIGSSEIHCNGRQWNGTVPHCQNTTVPAPTKCDFEGADLCWWRQDPTHDFDWKRHNFETPSLHIGTGPTHDHTLGAGNDGHYLYIEASGRLVNDTARIISPLYPSSLTESACFSFWYHMYGATIGSLNIYFKPENATETQKLMFTKSGNQGNQWFHGIFDLPHVSFDFQIIVEGVRGSSYVSDIAIDDIAILQGAQCNVKNETTNVTISNDDQVEVVNAGQSCRGRCDLSTTESSIFTSMTVESEICFCRIDCVERSLCCPDYAEYCILEFVAPVSDSNTISSGDNTTIAPVRKSTLTGFPINPKDDIDPGMSNSTTSTTKRRLVTTTIKTTTKQLPQITISVNATQKTKTTEVPLEHKIAMTTRYMEIQGRLDLHNAEQNPKKVRHGGGIEVLVIAIGATSTVLLAAFAIAIIVIKRRKTYKRGANGSALSEDSDVRFLTSDEILDFNLARPTDNDEM